MPDPLVSSEEARASAVRALASGAAADELAVEQGRLLDPLPIHSPEGSVVGWFVPVAWRDRLIGFAQVAADGQFHRYASFRRAASAGSWPLLEEWLDEARVLERARGAALPGDLLSSPRLSYDTHPDRIAWEVIATAATGGRRRVLIAGDAIWSAPLD